MNASDIHNAADTLERLHKQYEGMARAATVLRDLAVMENRIESAEARLAEVGQAKEKAEADLMAALEAIAQARQDAAGILEGARKTAEETVKGTNEVAASVMGDAQEEAQNIKALAERLAVDLKGQAAQLRAQAEADRVAAKAGLESMNTVLAERRAELARLDEKIAAARARVAEMLR